MFFYVFKFIIKYFLNLQFGVNNFYLFIYQDHKSTTKSNIINNTTTIDDETKNPDKELKLNENNLKENCKFVCFFIFFPNKLFCIKITIIFFLFYFIDIQKSPTKLPDILNSVQTVDNNNIDGNNIIIYLNNLLICYKYCCFIILLVPFFVLSSLLQLANDLIVNLKFFCI